MFKTYTDTVFKNYVNFTGKASRKTYWLFFIENLAVIIFIWVVMATEEVLIIRQHPFSSIKTGMDITAIIYGLAILLPFLGIQARRLHDVGLPGWPVLVSLIPWIVHKSMDVLAIINYTNKKIEMPGFYSLTATLMVIIYLQPSKKDEEIKTATLY